MLPEKDQNLPEPHRKGAEEQEFFAASYQLDAFGLCAAVSTEQLIQAEELLQNQNQRAGKKHNSKPETYCFAERNNGIQTIDREQCCPK